MSTGDLNTELAQAILRDVQEDPAIKGTPPIIVDRIVQETLRIAVEKLSDDLHDAESNGGATEESVAGHLLEYLQGDWTQCEGGEVLPDRLTLRDCEGAAFPSWHYDDEVVRPQQAAEAEGGE